MRPSPAGTMQAARPSGSFVQRHRDVGAAAGSDPRHLLLVEDLLRTDAVGPDAGRVDDVVGSDLEPLAGLGVATDDAVGPAVVRDQLGHPGAVAEHGAEALRLAQDGEHQAHVVGLAVVEEVGLARARAAPGRGRAPPPRRPGSCGGGRAPSSRPRPALLARGRGRRARAPGGRAFPGPPASSPSRRTCSARSRSAGRGGPRPGSGPGTASGRRGGARAGPSAGAPAAPRGRGRGRSSGGSEARRGPSSKSGSRCRGVVVALDQGDRVAARRGVERHPGAGDPAADHDDVEALSRRAPRVHSARESIGLVEVGDDLRRPGRARAPRCSCTGSPRWMQADEALVGAGPPPPGRGRAQHPGRSPVAGEAAGVGGEQDDVGGDMRSRAGPPRPGPGRR